MPMQDRTGSLWAFATTTAKRIAMAAAKAMVLLPDETRYTRMIRGSSR